MHTPAEVCAKSLGACFSCIEPCCQAGEETSVPAPYLRLAGAFERLPSRRRRPALDALGECPTVASNCLRDKLEACRDVRPFLLCAAGHLVEHLADVLERTGDVVEIAEVLACFKEVEMDAEAFEHDAARDPICPCWASRGIILNWSRFELCHGAHVEGGNSGYAVG